MNYNILVLDCPDEIPKYEFKVPTSTINQHTETEGSGLTGNIEMSDMSIESLEMDETNRSLSKKWDVIYKYFLNT